MMLPAGRSPREKLNIYYFLTKKPIILLKIRLTGSSGFDSMKIALLWASGLTMPFTA
jgi:hypothetical protein